MADSDSDCVLTEFTADAADYCTPERPFACTACCRTYSSQHSLKRHLRTDSAHVTGTADRRFACQDCDKKFTRKEHLKRHSVAKHTNNRPFPCTKCNRSFPRKDKLDFHMSSHDGNGSSRGGKSGSFLTSDVDAKSSDRAAARLSERGRDIGNTRSTIVSNTSGVIIGTVHHSNSSALIANISTTPVTTGNKYSVSIGAVYSTNPSTYITPNMATIRNAVDAIYNANASTVHGASASIACNATVNTDVNVCTSPSSIKNSMVSINRPAKRSKLTHIAHKSNIGTKSSDVANAATAYSGVLSCTRCVIQFNSLTDLHKHASSKHSTKFVNNNPRKQSYACADCNRRFGTRKQLRLEFNLAKHRYACKECCMTFAKSSEQIVHIGSIHAGRLPVTCVRCNECFLDATALEDHRLIVHVKNKRFQCVQCRDCFPHDRLLEQHIKRYSHCRVCSNCEKWFALESELRRHCDTHSNEQIADEAKYPCMVCSDMFYQALSLRQNGKIDATLKKLTDSHDPRLKSTATGGDASREGCEFPVSRNVRGRKSCDTVVIDLEDDETIVGDDFVQMCDDFSDDNCNQHRVARNKTKLNSEHSHESTYPHIVRLYGNKKQASVADTKREINCEETEEENAPDANEINNRQLRHSIENEDCGNPDNLFGINIKGEINREVLEEDSSADDNDDNTLYYKNQRRQDGGGKLFGIKLKSSMTLAKKAVNKQQSSSLVEPDGDSDEPGDDDESMGCILECRDETVPSRCSISRNDKVSLTMASSKSSTMDDNSSYRDSGQSDPSYVYKSGSRYRVKGRFPCDQCGRIYSRKDHVQRHVRSAHVNNANRKFVCTLCANTFLRDSDLTKHIDTYHNNRQLHATAAPFITTNQPSKVTNNLKLPKRSATVSMPDVTSEPESVMIQRACVDNDHSQNEPGTNMFACMICAVSFSTYDLLVRHLATHDKFHWKERKFRCPQCDKGFIQNNHLFLHIKRAHGKHLAHKASLCKYGADLIKFEATKDNYVFNDTLTFNRRDEDLDEIAEIQSYLVDNSFVGFPDSLSSAADNACTTDIAADAVVCNVAADAAACHFSAACDVTTDISTAAADVMDGGITVYMCPQCDAMLESSDQLADHLRTFHRLAPFICKIEKRERMA